MTAVDSTTELTPVHDLTAGDVFERHGRTWTVEHVVREWGGSVYVVCTNGGGVWFPAGAEVVVLPAQVDLRD